jgi:hypothetical protein
MRGVLKMPVVFRSKIALRASDGVPFFFIWFFNTQDILYGGFRCARLPIVLIFLLRINRPAW